MTFGLDTNILVYALDPDAGDRHHIASQIVARGIDLDMMLAAQVLGEYLNVARRKLPMRLSVALGIVDTVSEILPIIATTAGHISRAGHVSSRYDLQFWDALIIAVYGSANVSLMLSEDLQDDQTIDGVEILNPFDPANTERLAALLDR